MSDNDHVYYGIGDTLKKRKHLKRLPSGSIVKNKWDVEMYVNAHGTLTTWGRNVVDHGGTSNGPYTVLYLPQ